MAIPKSLLGTLALVWAGSVYAQQFDGASQPYDIFGLSSQCVGVLNTELSRCNSLLFWKTDRTLTSVIQVLSRDELDQLCLPQCREELSTLRKKIVATCTSPEDIVRHEGFEFPPTYFLDKFAFTFDINCHRHRGTGRLCDEVYAEWRAGKAEADTCDDCVLGPLTIQLSSPHGYSEKRAAELESLTSSCKATGYNYVTPTTFTRAAVPTPSHTPDVSIACERNYVMREGDDCHDIALSHNASTYSIVQNNALIDINCAVMPKPGTKLCLDKPCHTHKIQPGASCEDIAKANGIATEQFIALNPILDSTCSNIERWVGYVVCVGPDSLLPDVVDSRPSTSSIQSLFSANSSVEGAVGNSTPSDRPLTPLKPSAPNTPGHCTRLHNSVAATDPDFVDRASRRLATPRTLEIANRCHIVASTYRITYDELMRLNPTLAEQGNGCHLKGMYSYCVSGEGTEQWPEKD